jgi:hypothetical protein
MSGRLFLLVLALAALSRGEIIDRVAVTAGNRVITTSDILREIRLSAFMNQTEPNFSPEARKEAAGRLVERALIENEMRLGNYSTTQPVESGARQAPANSGVRQEDLESFLQQQAAVVRFIDARFGPAVQVLESDLRDYYAEHFVKESGNRAPAFEEVRPEIEEALRQQRANDLLDEWLKETKARTRIEYKPEAFQ